MVKSAPDSVAAFLRPATRGDKSGELLVIPGWRQADWEALFSYAQRVHVGRGHVLIRKQASERALFFLASGLLEVTAVLGSHSLGAIAKIHPGSVVGELAFLDGMPRSAKVWAVTDSDLYRLDFADYERFATAHPRQTCDLLFAIGRVVALRLRHSRTRLAQSS
jgi:CRP-like cAMP-binding protein